MFIRFWEREDSGFLENISGVLGPYFGSAILKKRQLNYERTSDLI